MIRQQAGSCMRFVLCIFFENKFTVVRQSYCKESLNNYMDFYASPVKHDASVVSGNFAKTVI